MCVRLRWRRRHTQETGLTVFHTPRARADGPRRAYRHFRRPRQSGRWSFFIIIITTVNLYRIRLVGVYANSPAIVRRAGTQKKKKWKKLQNRAKKLEFRTTFGFSVTHRGLRPFFAPPVYRDVKKNIYIYAQNNSERSLKTKREERRILVICAIIFRVKSLHAIGRAPVYLYVYATRYVIRFLFHFAFPPPTRRHISVLSAAFPVRRVVVFLPPKKTNDH